MEKVCYIIAGPNGAGKTTFAKEFLPVEAECLNFINADLIAQGLAPFQPDKAVIKAAKLMIHQIDECIRKEESFAFETTLSGRTYIKKIREMKVKRSWINFQTIYKPLADAWIVFDTSGSEPVIIEESR